MSVPILSRRALLVAATGTTATTTAARAVSSHSLAHRPRGASYVGGEQTRLRVGDAGASRGLHASAARSVSWRSLFGRRKKPTPTADSSTPDVASGFSQEMMRNQTRDQLQSHIMDPQVAASPLIASELAAAQKEGRLDQKSETALGRNDVGTSLLPEHLQRALDPDPRSRQRWERRMVMRHVGRMLDPQGRETKAERLARTERALLHKSTALPTSTKKLVHLARQISGKTLEDALVQMRFSKKKTAKDIIWHLEEARDIAVVERGMGLGLQGEAVKAADKVEIRTKDGKWLKVVDPTRIYIDQAWVGKGPYRAALPDYRARGRQNIKWSPTTYLSIILKEEKTRIRLHDERVAKEAKKAPWVHLPNRPVTAQRPYYSW